jgi:dephospho-CoA kinase
MEFMSIGQYFSGIKSSPDQGLVGITGGIGSGKSTVAAFIREAGYTVFSADDIARDLTNTHPEVKARINTAFGTMYLPDGTLDRMRMAGLVFGTTPEHAQNLVQVNSIVHPFVWQEVAQRAKARFDEGDRFVFNESALVFETGADKFYDLVVVVDAPEDVRVMRLAEGRGISEEEARRRIQAQLSADEKRARAGYVIHNHGSRSEVQAETKRFLTALELGSVKI